MIIKKILKLNTDFGGNKIYFSILETKEEIFDYFRLRHDVYSKHKYIDPSDASDQLEKDDYDINGKCVYFGVYTDKILIGGVRIIRDSILPIDKNFSYTFSQEPDVAVPLNKRQRIEISRLVIDYTKSTFKIPKNVLLFFIFLSVSEWAVDDGAKICLAFIKKHLLRKIILGGAPITKSTSYALKDVSSSPMKNYFLDQENPAIPCFFYPEEMHSYLNKITNNQWTFKKTEDNITHEMKNSTTNHILNMIGII